MVSKYFLGVPCGRAAMGFALLGAALLSALANATLHIPNALRHSNKLDNQHQKYFQQSINNTPSCEPHRIKLTLPFKNSSSPLSKTTLT